MSRLIRSVLITIGLASIAVAQPVVTGALNTASYVVPGFPNAGLAQGGMIAIFGRNLGPAVIAQAGSFPLPLELGGTTAKLSVGGQAVDLILTYSLAGQVGAIVPSNTPAGPGQLTVTFGGQTSAPFSVSVVASQFGIFTINQGGSGPAVVQNFNSQTDQPVNTILNSAKPSQVMTLWGTGLGPIQGSDRGAPPAGDLNIPIEVLVGGKRANVLYKGRSGCCSGVDQIVFEVPGGTSGCYVPLVVKNGNSVSNFSSIAVSPNGGACSDPFGYTASELATASSTGKLSVGSVNLVKTSTKVSAGGFTVDSSVEIGAASFYSYDLNQLLASRGPGGTAVTVGSCSLFTYAFTGDSGSPVDPIRARVLDAGASINVSGPNGAKQLAKIQGGTYNTILANVTGLPGGIPGLPGGIPGLPGGSSSYLTAGAYTTDNGTGGVDVGGFRANLNIPANFSWTNEGSITGVNRSGDLEITWTGSDANGYVFVTGSAFDPSLKVGAGFYCMERGSASRLTVPAAILLGMPASATIQGSPTGTLSVGVTNEPARFTARGIDVGTFTFTSLTAKQVSYR